MATEVTGINQNFAMVTCVFGGIKRASSWISSLCITTSGSTNHSIMRNEISEAAFLADQAILKQMRENFTHTNSSVTKEFRLFDAILTQGFSSLTVLQFRPVVQVVCR
ncbi:hypothetical protein [Anditalea andensis]|nr:hypothetical protein [Anditalea andensis]